MFKVKKEVVLNFLESYERTEKSFQQDVNIIIEWLKTQPHFPEIMDEKRVRNYLLMNKCRIEKTKQQIDNYYTVRAVVPELLLDVDSKEVELARDTLSFVQLPQLTPEGYRVHVIKVLQPSTIDIIHPEHFISHCIDIQEIRIIEDIFYSDVCLIDMEGLSLSFLLKLTPTVISKFLKIYEKVLSNRLAQVNVINPVPFLEKLLPLVKALMKPKLFQRIFIYAKTDDLYKNFSKEMMPKDLGGDEASLRELYELQKLKLKEYREHLKFVKSLRVNESLRPEELKNDDILGFYGNFKKIDVD